MRQAPSSGWLSTQPPLFVGRPFPPPLRFGETRRSLGEGGQGRRSGGPERPALLLCFPFARNTTARNKGGATCMAVVGLFCSVSQRLRRLVCRSHSRRRLPTARRIALTAIPT